MPFQGELPSASELAESISLTDHCISRFRKRSKSREALSPFPRLELRRLIAEYGSVSASAPSWMKESERETDYFCLIILQREQLVIPVIIDELPIALTLIARPKR
jgi:hypothetical protein